MLAAGRRPRPAALAVSPVPGPDSDPALAARLSDSAPDSPRPDPSAFRAASSRS